MDLKKVLLWDYSDKIVDNTRKIRVKAGLIPNALIVLTVVYIIYSKFFKG